MAFLGKRPQKTYWKKGPKHTKGFKKDRKKAFFGFLIFQALLS